MRTAMLACCATLAAVMSPAAAISLQLPRNGAYEVAQDGLSGATILIVRHAEKPGQGTT